MNKILDEQQKIKGRRYTREEEAQIRIAKIIAAFELRLKEARKRYEEDETVRGKYSGR